MSGILDFEISELIDLLRFPSFRGNGGAKRDAANYCARLLRESGFETLLTGAWEAPTIIARVNGNRAEHLLFYNHYDVLPPGDEHAWTSDPFVPTVVDGVLFGRGTSDHKASFVARLTAVRNLLKRGELPVGITFLVDGEEEIGSPSLETIIVDHKELLRADGGLYSGGARAENGSMVIRAGCKGRCELELAVTYGDRDNHSKWAAILHNPAWRLVGALSTLYDGLTDEVRLDGHRSGARHPDARDQKAMESLPFDRNAFLGSVGHTRLRPDAEENPLRSLMFSPTLNLAWLASGGGGGSVLPGTARAKLDIRLVPDQRPDDMARRVMDHLSEKGFGDVSVTYNGGSEPDKCDIDDPVVVALTEACAEFDGPAALHPMGAGSGPRYLFRRHLGYSLIQDPGCSWSGSNDHGPNENIRLDHYYENRALMESFLQKYGGLKSQVRH